MPLSTPYNPDAQEEVGDGMGGNRVAQTFFPAYESLIGCGAENARQPLIVREAEYQRGKDEWFPGELAKRHGFKIGLGDPSVEKRPVKYFFKRGDDE